MNQLKQRLRELAAAGVASDYVVEMWQLVLTAHEKEQDGKTLRINEDCDAIPYLPTEFASDHVALTSESRVLDIGCLGGYGLYDYVERRRQAKRPVPQLVGMDKEEGSVQSAQRLAEIWAADTKIEFKVGEANDVPLADATCDLVLARLLLPYVRVWETLNEVKRVLKPDGLVLFQVHAPRYYRRQAKRQGWALGKRLYYVRPRLSRWLFWFSGRQPTGKRWAEMAMTPRALKRLCVPLGLVPVWEGGFASKPLVAFRREMPTDLSD